MKFLFILLSLRSSCSLKLEGGQFPSFREARPCNTSPELCQQGYFRDQKNLQFNEITSGATRDEVSVNELRAHVDTLKANAEDLSQVMDADGSRTNGGEIRNLANGSQVFGLVPFMKKLSGRILQGNNVRLQAMSQRISEINAGMVGIDKLLNEANIRGGTDLVTTSEKIKSDITATSKSLQELLTGMDAQLVSESSLFDSSLQNGPVAGHDSLKRSLDNMSESLKDSRKKFNDIHTKTVSLGPEFDAFLRETLVEAEDYIRGQVGGGSGTTVMTAFKNQAAAQLAKLVAQLKGQLAAVASDPFYASSVPGYIADQTARLGRAISSGNSHVQSRVNRLSDDLNSVRRQVSTVFGPIKDGMGLTQRASPFLRFQASTQRALDSSAAIRLKGTSSFANFKSDLEKVWKITASVLNGQTTTITKELLNKISALTQDAGKEVVRLNQLMVEASSTALQSDAARQSVLASSKTQVESMIGSNEAGVAASFKKINAFLATSKSELAQIMALTQLMASTQAGNMGAVGTSSMDKLQALVTTTRAGAAALLATLQKSVLADVAQDFASLGATFKATNAAGTAFASGTGKQMNSANAANSAASQKISANLDLAKNNLDTVVGTTRKLAAASDTVVAESQTAAKRVASALAKSLDALDMKKIVAELEKSVVAAQKNLDVNANSVGQLSATTLGKMRTAIAASSNAYTASTKKIDSKFDSLVAKIGSERTVFESQISDLDSKVMRIAEVIAALVRTGNNAAAPESPAERLAAAAAAAQARLLAQLVGASGPDVPRLASQVAGLEADWNALVARSLVANQLPLEMKLELADLKSKYLSKIQTLTSAVLPASASSSVIPNADIASFESDLAEAKAGVSKTVAAGLAEARNISESGIARAQALLNESPAQVVQDISFVRDFTTSINSTFYGYKLDLDMVRNEIFSKFENAKLFSNSLNQVRLETDSTGVATNKITQQMVNVTSELVLKFGASIATKILNAIESGEMKLSTSQKNMIIRQLLGANIAYDSATVMSHLGVLLESAMTEIISVPSGEAPVLVDGPIGKAGNISVQITAGELAAIIALYSTDTAAEAAALRAQLAAAGKANASVADAVQIWTKLSQEVNNLSHDEFENLMEMQNELIDDLHADSNNDVLLSTIRKEIIRKNINVSDPNVLVLAELDKIDSEAIDSKDVFDGELRSIEHDIYKVIPKLENRMNIILGNPFPNSLETAAIKDLS